jgi:hypothetical protein
MKGKVMAKGKNGTKPGDQLELIDVAPKNARPIIEVAREYKKAMLMRLKYGNREVELKKKIRELVNNAGLQRLKDGSIRFEYDGVTVSVTPQDEKVTVKEKGDKA